MSEHGPAARPCGSCPYRRDVPSGVWSEEEYDKLPAYDNETADQPFGAFFCHQQDGRLCAGWVGCHDMDNSLALRLAGAARVLTAEDVDAARAYECPVPLFESGALAAAHGKAEIILPGPKARRAITKLQRRRPAAYGAAEQLPPPTSAPCNECPWRKNSLAGWLGPYSAKRWIQIAHGDGAIACHKTIRESGSWDGASQCAGAASFRANVCKRPRDPSVVTGPPSGDVFGSNEEFVQHHTYGEESWSVGDLYAELEE